MTTRASIRKQLAALKTVVEEDFQIRAEVEARNVTPERMREIMQQRNEAHRQGGEEAYTAFLKTLTAGELLRLRREVDHWVKDEAKGITPEHIARLEADGVPVERFTDAELYAVAANFGDDPVDWSALPDDVIDAIAEDPDQVDFEDLARRYPNKNYRKES